MLGAVVATAVAALAGMRLEVPVTLRSTMFPVLGVMLGATFTPDLADRIATWPLTLAGLLVYLPVTVALLYLYFRRLSGFDRLTAYFSAVPGGFSEMVVVGAEMGADVRRVALVHACRIALTVMIVPVAFQAFGIGGAIAPAPGDAPAPDLAALTLCGVVGYVVGGWLRLPAHRMVGPLLASAALHVGGYSAGAPPLELVAFAQLVVGASVGARFTGIAPGMVMQMLWVSVGATLIMFTVMLAFVTALLPWVSVDFAALTLAYAPGGFPEMSLVALALGVETAFVATHHFARVVLLVLSAPLVLKLFGISRGDEAEP